MVMRRDAPQDFWYFLFQRVQLCFLLICPPDEVCWDTNQLENPTYWNDLVWAIACYDIFRVVVFTSEAVFIVEMPGPCDFNIRRIVWSWSLLAKRFRRGTAKCCTKWPNSSLGEHIHSAFFKHFLAISALLRWMLHWECFSCQIWVIYRTKRNRRFCYRVIRGNKAWNHGRKRSLDKKFMATIQNRESSM